ncbi:tRNA (adenosine(37)-N6)-dimethylallyltransferase MiaA [Paraflavitalea soli]|uniref:tRNA dimethylallyltransferase n=1 Tax=Paraflavitalea soli TaxID=2315862 RepID=A0A3B7MU50_9BACT|nr:tRNA (adenosine(37)-N6)-dimethylallyltransferase MiaA [Paraflavitalea soli]AXY78052.1 tRNA (adenosine(37)-N6)-dimethylallyltransferase MiaA [Paraflavitalea soli]
MQHTCIVIVGPTAVGKTALAIRMAEHFNTAIISADSRQCYREMTIGVAKPSVEELARVHHYFINSHSIHQEVNAALFEQYALQSVNYLYGQRAVAVMTGGTGLYVKAFCEGLDDIPPVSLEVRERITKEFQQQGLAWLQQEVAEQDPLYYSTGEIQNPHRLLRALEVKLVTGQSIRTFQQGKKAIRPFRIVKIGLELPKEDLHRNINQRVENMMQEGLLEEVQSLLPWRHLNALQTVGYNELFQYLDGNCTLPEAVEAIKTNTRHYAKRQMTWFRKSIDIQWFSPTNDAAILDYCQSVMAGA